MMDKETLQQRIDELISMTDKFCNEHIDAEYAALCKLMIEKLGRKRMVKPLATGRLNIWAAAVVYTIATNNFLFDRSFKPYIPTSELHDYFETKPSTVSAKAAQIRQLLNLAHHFEPGFLAKSTLDNNPYFLFSRLGALLRMKSRMK